MKSNNVDLYLISTGKAMREEILGKNHFNLIQYFTDVHLGLTSKEKVDKIEHIVNRAVRNKRVDISQIAVQDDSPDILSDVRDRFGQAIFLIGVVSDLNTRGELLQYADVVVSNLQGLLNLYRFSSSSVETIPCRSRTAEELVKNTGEGSLPRTRTVQGLAVGYSGCKSQAASSRLQGYSVAKSRNEYRESSIEYRKSSSSSVEEEMIKSLVQKSRAKKQGHMIEVLFRKMSDEDIAILIGMCKDEGISNTARQKAVLAIVSPYGVGKKLARIIINVVMDVVGVAKKVGKTKTKKKQAPCAPLPHSNNAIVEDSCAAYRLWRRFSSFGKNKDVRKVMHSLLSATGLYKTIAFGTGVSVLLWWVFGLPLALSPPGALLVGLLTGMTVLIAKDCLMGENLTFELSSENALANILTTIFLAVTLSIISYFSLAGISFFSLIICSFLLPYIWLRNRREAASLTKFLETTMRVWKAIPFDMRRASKAIAIILVMLMLVYESQPYLFTYLNSKIEKEFACGISQGVTRPRCSPFTRERGYCADIESFFHNLDFEIIYSAPSSDLFNRLVKNGVMPPIDDPGIIGLTIKDRNGNILEQYHKQFAISQFDDLHPLIWNALVIRENEEFSPWEVSTKNVAIEIDRLMVSAWRKLIKHSRFSRGGSEAISTIPLQKAKIYFSPNGQTRNHNNNAVLEKARQFLTASLELYSQGKTIPPELKQRILVDYNNRVCKIW